MVYMIIIPNGNSIFCLQHTYVFQLIPTLISDNLTNPSTNILVLLTVTASVLFDIKSQPINAILIR
jgi:hypothetical protein